MERVENVVEEKGEQTDEDESASHSDESQAEEADTESHKEEKVRVIESCRLCLLQTIKFTALVTQTHSQFDI